MVRMMNALITSYNSISHFASILSRLDLGREAMGKRGRVVWDSGRDAQVDGDAKEQRGRPPRR